MVDEKILVLVSAILTICLTISEWLGMSKCTAANSIVQLLLGWIKKEEKVDQEEERNKRRKVVTFQE
jgi:hypothetical protein